MKAQFINILQYSFFSFIEHGFLNNGEAYYNTSSKFYYVEDKRQPQYYRYSAPYKQFIHDSSISGANIFSGVSGSFGLLGNGTSGVRFDYDNGSILVPTSLGKNLNITGSYAVKDFNFYKANDLLEPVITENKYEMNSRFKRTQSGISPYSYVMPAIFISNRFGENKPFALGGLKDNECYFSCVLVHEDSDVIDGALSVLQDFCHKSFPILPLSSDPLDQFGALKTGHFSYDDLAAVYNTPGNLSFIQSVRISKISDKIKSDPNLFYGIADFKISSIRQI